jgi:hypothetical protein
LVKKMITFWRHSLSERYIRGCQRRDVPLLLRGFNGAAAPLPSSPKPLTLSQSIEKLLHFEIVLMEKTRKIVIFGNFEMSPRCHGNRKFNIKGYGPVNIW